ncbi:hypothetical protein PFMG_00334 [Plasmodium falciparum IGH-CR14]|uniref:Uncharacterized protein n=10 Tax=Plasmodium falciparum TaxID=5833 RepID=Q8I3Y5_PLAF7|nr:conserved protein, unknown function [Plasmodium falciparum 3D7]ETW20120.1 hypothetical protein PFFVO_01021 [Plasmodium falciparum Vietnam Oak-Knoll (FVO)]ETW38162.1 hypothetical protein PFTANZ_01123 [Plasmodium falciparum Tanzania (2000708)]ETW53519.1 hypothetical protein PFUGPA_04534 [Plasmodium falciparum Palo Alto/Uganda]EUR77431.1 hypothetical protein PFBG_01008 [Plasmodium falciparum 7G8]KAF4328655.1 hypothetical protein CYL21_3427 [Plasmodium falciparum NF54]KNG74318.1 hypothetical p|eukprot:XP_001351678.1 conserved Plasmodium protein, unknown function [Plasmodium falciparum 3D7]
MFYILNNVLKNIKTLDNVKSKFFLKDSFLKNKLKANNLDDNLSSHIFFNEIFVSLRDDEKKEEHKKVLLFNKVRNDKKHRKRAFQKRGYWKKMHYFIRKNNMMSYAFKVQNIDYEKIKKLKRGEVYSN